MIFYRGHSISPEFAGIGKPDEFLVRRIAANGVTAMSISGPYASAADARAAIDAALAVSPLTADTITDEQIRELMSTRAAVGDERTVTTCFEALGPSDMFWSWQQPTPADVRAARARCAEILNARGGK